MKCPSLANELPHLWTEIRPGVRCCSACHLLECDVVGNLVHFPIGLQNFPKPSGRFGGNTANKGKVIRIGKGLS